MIDIIFGGSALKKLAFVSDFDGTLSDRDFYHIVIDKYLASWGRQFYEEWKKSKKINVEFLNRIFGSMDRDEDEILKDILEIPLDPYAKDFISFIQESGGDFYILSAGTSYYIEKIIEHFGLKNVTVISMRGIYKNRGIEIIPDPTDEFYSDVFGLDKAKVILSLKNKYDKVFFAGDSEPDMMAAQAADCAFAKGELQILLRDNGIEFIPFNRFIQVKNYITGNCLI
jgi:2,3-diketo-5-methylthio-1-phosphopentane phosphatase